MNLLKTSQIRGGGRLAASFGRAALVAAAICVAMAPSSSFAEAKSATLSATGYSGTETLTGFPALVRLSASNDAYGFSYSDCVNGKDDLWFEDADGNLIPHDVDTWNETGDSYVWVRIPSLSTGAKIVMHWGAARTAEQTCTPADTWAGYVGVWHMNETGTTAEPDSTANELDATPLTSSSASTSLNTATGAVGAGRAILSDGKYFSVGSSSNPYHSTLTTKANFSVSGWCKLSSIPDGNGYQRIFCGMSLSSLNSWDVWREHATQIGVRSGNGSGNNGSTAYKVAIAEGETAAHYLTIVWEGASATVYENGALVASQTLRANTHPNSVFTIGGRVGIPNRSFIGVFDEVRMYDGVVSANRAAADYATMNAPTTFLTLVSDDTIVTAEWTGAADDGDVTNPANWNCYNADGNKVDNKLPTAVTAVTVTGDNLNIQAPAGTSLEYSSFTLGSATLARDCDLTGVDVVVASDATIDLKGYALFVKGLSGGGTITSTADADAAYATLDFIQADNNNASQYIITDYTPRYSDTFVTRVNFQSVIDQCIYCARGGSVASGSYTGITYDNNKWRFDHVTAQGSKLGVPPVNVDCSLTINGKTGVCKVNGESLYTMATSDDDTATAASVLSFFILNNNASGAAMAYYGQANFKMYFFRIYDVNGAIVRDYVPAKNGSGVAGLWDRVNNVFWPSAGASQFIAGSETARGEVVFCGTGTWSGVTIAPAVTVVKDCGGTLMRDAHINIGVSGDGTPSFVFDDGTAKFSTINAGQAEFNVHGGTVNVPTWIDWGSRANATAVWNQYGGTVSQSGGNFWIGRLDKCTGIYNLYGGTLTKSGGSFSLGQVTDSTGYFNMTNGTFTCNVDMYLGADPGGVGHFTASGGTLNAHTLRVGNNGAGTFDQSGGTVNVNSYLWIGAEAKSATGTYTMTGGTLTVPNQPVSVGRYGTGTLDVSGTAVVTASKGVRVGFTNGSNAGTGTLVVTNGGTVATSSIYGGGSTDAQATVLFDGATVRTTEAGAILKDLASVTIGRDGLTIDNAYAASATNTTFKVAPGMTAITMTGAGTLDLSQATVELASAPHGKFVLATATGSGTFTGVPSVVRADGESTKRVRVRLANGGKDIEVLSGGFTILIRGT